jgi:hypothetical protein
MFVCEKAPLAADILRVPLDFTVKNGNVQFARPLFSLNGQRVLGSELGSGTVDQDGKIHVVSSYSLRGVTYQGDYSGMLTASAGTLIGTQSWVVPNGGSGSRTCVAAVVPAPRVRRAER